MARNSASKDNAKRVRMKGKGRAVLEAYRKHNGLNLHQDDIPGLCDQIKAYPGNDHVGPTQIITWFQSRARKDRKSPRQELPSKTTRSTRGGHASKAAATAVSHSDDHPVQQPSQGDVGLSVAEDAQGCCLSPAQIHQLGILLLKPRDDIEFIETLAHLVNVPRGVILAHLDALTPPPPTPVYFPPSPVDSVSSPCVPSVYIPSGGYPFTVMEIIDHGPIAPQTNLDFGCDQGWQNDAGSEWYPQ